MDDRIRGNLGPDIELRFTNLENWICRLCRLLVNPPYLSMENKILGDPSGSSGILTKFRNMLRQGNPEK